ncbi:hypothetical protein IMZ08_03840 [Bacillus luteolus]|uniref:N-acetyltransferase domain-containing protein n=1 Tax=Litchfieldia luteola TaxID=682179 RepID=A0ABR9QFC8_9BACI|nr:hypothetical protein [Cytobacillus luteolus]MBE4907190.1 hypothetical protein [Cytobacillus luteolus]MBP1943338.1 hypothetical protein [Cytobacillus luteolus]
MDCWLEKGYMLDPSSDKSDKYIIQNTDKTNVGTIEFKPYTISNENNINTVFPFNEIASIVTNPEKVVEIDKVAILKQYRGKNLERLIKLYVSYTESKGIEYCVVLLERIFYKALKNVYKIPLESVGDPIYYKGDHVIPTIMYPRAIYSAKDNYQRLVNVELEYERPLINS